MAIPIKTSEELNRMRQSCRLASKIRDSIVKNIKPGVTTAELDDYARGLLKEYNAKSAFLGYKIPGYKDGYPGVICVSINETVVHGIPGKRKIMQGDIVSIDVGVEYDGYIGDTAKTVAVAVSDPILLRLVKTTEMALTNGINVAKNGARLSDISHAIEQTAIAEGFSVVKAFVGHGIGKKIHEEPQIPNFGAPGHGPVLQTGMTFAIEPMLNMGKSDVEILEDGWTVVTVDRKPSAHFEHTIAILDGEAEILTL